MSLLSPQIRALRAEARGLHAEAETLDDGTSEQAAAAYVLLGIAGAKLAAADELEAHEASLTNVIVEIPARGQ